ncbi:hypothetical protein K493DRAFT_310848, partial [Basidiobolus meristosporus CBS 931.73]
MASNQVYDPIRDAWAPNDSYQHVSKEPNSPTKSTVTLKEISRAEELTSNSPQLAGTSLLSTREAAPLKSAKKVLPSLIKPTGGEPAHPALPSSPPLSPIIVTKKRRRSLSSTVSAHETTSTTKRKITHEAVQESPTEDKPPAKTTLKRGGLLNLSELCNDDLAGTGSIDLDFIQDYYKQCEPTASNKQPGIKGKATLDAKAPKSLGQISSMEEELSLEAPEAELDGQGFDEGAMLNVEETIESIESFLTQDVDIFGAISEENPITSNWSMLANRRKPISSLLLSDTSDNE